MSKKPAQKVAGCCGPIQDRIALIRQVSQGLRDGHFGIAQLYRQIAEDIENGKEKKQYEKIVADHIRMGEASLQILVPNDYVDPEEQG